MTELTVGRREARSEKEKRGSFTAAYSLLHSQDGKIVYVNRSQEPVFFSSKEAEEDVQRYARKLGQSSAACVINETCGPGRTQSHAICAPLAIIAVVRRAI
jgi:hypothetical protein